MKFILSILLLSASLFASGTRTFTDEESGRTLEASLVGKSPKGDKVTLRLDNGRVVTVETKRLVEADRTYIDRWMNPRDQVTCRVDGKPFDGYKHVTVQAEAGPGTATLVIHPGVFEFGTRTVIPFKKEMKAGESFSQRLVLPNKYTVTLTNESGATLDQETHGKKTGVK